ncbi:MAG: hypothetical protein JWL76_574 [Thermoleophilia bacterium]|nr:hypothetical protein [Thermoleophilia bacterium]
MRGTEITRGPTSTIVALVAALAACFVLPSIAMAAPPVNDDFASATVIGASPTTIATTNVEATEEAGEPEHGDGGGNSYGSTSVWYRWTATFTGVAVADTKGSGWDTMMAAYTGASVSTLTRLAGNDDGYPGIIDSRIAFPVTSGTVYYIALDGFHGATSPITFRLNRAWNNNFTEAFVLGTSATRGMFDNYFSNKEAGEPNHAGNVGGASVWFTYTPTANGTVWIDTLGLDTTVDTVIGVYTGAAVGSLTMVANNDDWAAGETRSRVSFAGVAGTTYRIAVDGKAGAAGYFNLRWGPAPPTNDNFSAAVTLAGATASSTGNSTFATKQVGEPTFFGGESSIWYQWTAPSSGGVRIDTLGSNFDVEIGVYTGAAVNSLTEIIKQDDHCQNSLGLLTSRTGFAAVAGTTYRFMVDGTQGRWGAVNINLTMTPPANDMFSAPTTLVGGSVSSGCDHNFAATQEAGEPEHGECVCDSGDSSVWYSWTATATGTAVFTTGHQDTDFDSMIGVYTGAAVNALTIIDRNDDHPLGDARVEVPVTSGTTYRIAVDGFTTSRGNFIVTVNPPPPNGPVSDGSVAGADLDWQQSTTAISATWDAASQEPVIGYDWCIVPNAPSSTCTGSIASGSTATLAFTQAGVYSERTYFSCVRSKTAFVTATQYECSDGIGVDASVPASAGVRDSLGADVDTTGSTTTLAANWDSITDPGVGFNHYEYCIGTLTACGGTLVVNWTSTGTTTSVTRAGLTLANGQSYYVCVRGHDDLGNVSPATCTDGITVTIAGPTVTSLAPASGAQGRQDLAVTITGTGFVNGATVTIAGADVVVQSRTWVSATRIDAVLDISSSGTPSARDVTVTNPDTTNGTKPGGFTVTAASITVSLSVLGYDAPARDATLPYDLAFGSQQPGTIREIGPAGSGQRTAGAAVDVTITADTDVTLSHSFAGWSGPSPIPAGTFTWRRNGTANPWVAMPTATTAERTFVPPVSGTFGYDYRISLPAAQQAGAYSTSVAYTVVATV